MYVYMEIEENRLKQNALLGSLKQPLFLFVVNNIVNPIVSHIRLALPFILFRMNAFNR